jgi:hypothetical protein
LSVPRFRRRIADFTAFEAPRPYFFAMVQLPVTAATASTTPNRSRVRLPLEWRAASQRRNAHVATDTTP